MNATSTPDASQDLVGRINRLRKERRAVILAHNYQLGEVQDVADFTGDSLDLSRRAAATDAEVIVFCGVHFMAETAKILSPHKTVLLPDPASGCPMADMIDGPALRRMKTEHPGAAVVCYVNSSAEVKADCDVCCTSANADKVVASIPADREVLFVPDKYLGGHVQRKLGRPMLLWPGFCPTHARILPEHVERRKRENPGAVVLAHPECRAEVSALADAVLSTSGMLRFARENDARVFVVATELGLLHRLQLENPGKTFVAATEQAVCPNMKRNTLEKVLWALEELQTPIEVPEDVRVRAETSLQRMLELR
ncbi:MAG: quinolinate synthase NadA [Deltaproteobacteria bacterium]|nr:quinolinate synthase NadA [Deltaproteobacteria bacterium]